MNEKGDVSFRGRLAFVTGGASGIGLAIGRELAARGMKVVLADLDQARLDEAAANVTGASTALLDVRDPQMWHEALDVAETAHGPLTVLISNAGVYGARQNVGEIDPAVWNWAMDVNLNGVFHSLNQGLPRLRRSGGPAHVVVTASLSAMLMDTGLATYSATKAAVVAMCEVLRCELRDTAIGISVLLPAHVRTSIIEANADRAPDGMSVGERDPALETAVRAGVDPAVVGRQVADAIGSKRFWLFTHPETRPYLQARSAEIDLALAGQD